MTNIFDVFDKSISVQNKNKKHAIREGGREEVDRVTPSKKSKQKKERSEKRERFFFSSASFTLLSICKLALQTLFGPISSLHDDIKSESNDSFRGKFQ